MAGHISRLARFFAVADRCSASRNELSLLLKPAEATFAMNLRLTVYLMDGTRDQMEVWMEIGTASDFMYRLRRNQGFLAGDTWYPLHGILKLQAEEVSNNDKAQDELQE